MKPETMKSARSERPRRTSISRSRSAPPIGLVAEWRFIGAEVLVERVGPAVVFPLLGSNGEATLASRSRATDYTQLLAVADAAQVTSTALYWRICV